MKLKLKVLDPKLPKLTIKELREKKIPIKDLDERWNLEIEFEVPERLILNLVDDLIDKLMDNKEIHHYEGEKSSSLKKQISLNDANNFIKSARAWRKLHVMISDEGFQTSRFTRLSLFEILLNIPEMNKRMNMKIHEMQQDSLKQVKKIPEETPKSELTPKINTSIFTEFVNKIN
jgi:hypothetical protein